MAVYEKLMFIDSNIQRIDQIDKLMSIDDLTPNQRKIVRDFFYAHIEEIKKIMTKKIDTILISTE